MKNYPWWLLLLNALLLLPVLVCPVFLFGGVHLFRSEGSVWQAVNYLLVQLVWVVPVLVALKSLDLYRVGRTARSLAVCLSGLVALALYSWLLLS